MIAWLTAIGFTEHATYRDEADPSVVVHAEWLWPGGGGIMFGIPAPGRRPSTTSAARAAYLVTDDLDGVFDRAVAAGATRRGASCVDEDYGGRGGSVARSGGQPLVLRELPAPD